MKKLFFLLAMCLLMAACSSQPDEPRMADSPVSTEENGLIITESEAISRASQAFTYFFGDAEGVNSRSARTGRATIYGMNQSRDLDAPNPLYAVNFEEGGFVLISALRDGNSVPYAISDTGVFDTAENPAAAEFINLYLSDSDAKNDSIYKKINFDPVYEIVTEIVPEGWRTDPLDSRYFLEDKHSKSAVVRDVPVKWGQSYPYNKYCFTKSGEQALVGCMAVAVGQIAAYKKSPAMLDGYSFHWDDMTSAPSIWDLTSQGMDDVARLLSIVGNKAGMDYGVDGSGASLEGGLNAFRQMGYAKARITESRSDCINSLPSLMVGSTNSGVGHAWVVDGYKYERTEIVRHPKTNHSVTIPYLGYSNGYLKFNWGWNGSCDGYYMYIHGSFDASMSSSWNTTEYNFAPRNDLVFSKGFKYIVGI